MSEDYREIEVVDVGSGPPRPARPPRVGNRTELLLIVLVVGVFVGAACSAFGAWTAYQSQQDSRMLECMYVGSSFDGSDNAPNYDQLPKAQRRLIDRFDCDVPGR